MAPGMAPVNRSARGRGARKDARRAVYPWINGRIIAVAETGDLPMLVSLVEFHVSEMNLVNIATALHRLARLANAGQTDLRLEGLLWRLSEGAKGLLKRAQAGAGGAHPQALSNIAWSLAMLRFADLDLLRSLVEVALLRAEGFKPFELSSILWAYATLGRLDPQAWSCSALLFEVAADVIVRHPEEFSFRCLVMIVWAFATAGYRRRQLFLAVTPRLRDLADTGSARELDSAVWALDWAGVHEESLHQVLEWKIANQDLPFSTRESRAAESATQQAAPMPAPRSAGIATDQAPVADWAAGVVVKNTFLDIETADEPEDLGSRDGYPRPRPLPPSLGFLPSDICPEKLEAYRMNYQRFRVGYHSGARGELTGAVRRENSA